MTTSTDSKTHQKPLRLWPGVVIVILQWLGRFIIPIFLPEALFYGVMGGLVGGLAIALWWLFFSRAPWSERLGAIVLMVVAVIATKPLLHESIATGMMGMMFIIYVVPGLSLAFVLWAVACRHLATVPRRAALVAFIVVACGVWTLVRTGGFGGNLDNDWAWRWSPTPEDLLLAQAEEPLLTPPATPQTAAETTEPAATEGSAPPAPDATEPDPAETVSTPEATEPATTAPEASEPAAAEPARPAPQWPGFRGANRDSIIPGVQIASDWSSSPPSELWRRAVGPGWSSFAVDGDLFYTQEQRGEDEVVAGYKVSTGEPVWRHGDTARFWESNAGAGPRGTPTLSNGRVYTLGATGILNALDAANGAVVWSRNAASDHKIETPYWGFSGSPLVMGDTVIVAVSGQLAAYDLMTGEPRWSGPEGKVSYASPHLLTIDGVEQVLLLNGPNLISVAPGDGTLLWEHAWSGYPIVQPALTADGDVLISVNQDSGIRRLAIDHGADGWSVAERWTSLGLKPYFNDFVVHEGHAYGFDGSILSCIDVADGERKWKGGRYGGGQLFLLADQDLLLVLSEQGELALVNATPDRYQELARWPAVEGKTWNHPVLVGDVLLVRNDREMAAFRLAMAGD